MNNGLRHEPEHDDEFSPQPLLPSVPVSDADALGEGEASAASGGDAHAADGRSGARPIKVCLYSHDTFGLGHLRRNLAIAERLLSHEGRFSVWLLTGSPVIRQWRLPAGLHVQPLPPVVKTGAERYASRKAGETFGMVKGYREALILKLVLRQRPDILLVDHAPAGMHGELLATLALMRRELPKSRTVLGLRDILDSPPVVRQLWQEQDIHGLIEQAYDHVLVYGSRQVFNVVEAYGLPPNLARKVNYCGYVVSRGCTSSVTAPGAGEVCWSTPRAGSRPVVLVTAGGGGDGHFLMDAYLKALQTVPMNQCYSVIVTGPLMPREQRDALQAAVALRTDVEFVDYTTNLVPSVQSAELIVAMAGYNTSAEIIAARKKAILVPRAAPREEQRLRARLLAARGLAWYAEPGPALAQALAALLPTVLAAPSPTPFDISGLDLNGAEKAASLLLALCDHNMERLEGAA
ncbi:MAG: glycosyltransferase [Betaproteobacteria bacterium]|nr:glycosyltransferase [Betaproteobacteria bacterium]